VVSGDSQGVQASSKLNGKADNSDTRKKRAKKSTSTTRLPLSANSIAAEPNDASNDEVSDETRETVATSRQQASKANQTDDAKAATAESSKAPLPSAAETEAELKALRDQLAEDAPKPLSSDVLEVTASTASSTIKKSSASTAKSKSAGTKTAAGKTTAGKKGKTSATAKKDRPHKLSETEVDDDELTRLFDPVEQHDDLKQIFGIGPVTEKTLNKLGITAYSQLAELKQHDIEKIANALQIFPGRIERDNWVGSARAQLEEVLEDL